MHFVSHRDRRRDWLHRVTISGLNLPPTFRMILKIVKTGVTTSALLLGISWTPIQAQSTDAKPKPDNTTVNKPDKNSDDATADQQKMTAADRELTAKIRRSIMADKSLSTYAHNVKIISRDGSVTLKGPVRSDDEVKSIVAMAVEATGSPDNVINQMSVAPSSKR
jgi:hyperosmotically inducible protein